MTVTFRRRQACWPTAWPTAWLTVVLVGVAAQYAIDEDQEAGGENPALLHEYEGLLLKDKETSAPLNT